MSSQQFSALQSETQKTFNRAVCYGIADPHGFLFVSELHPSTDGLMLSKPWYPETHETRDLANTVHLRPSDLCDVAVDLASPLGVLFIYDESCEKISAEELCYE